MVVVSEIEDIKGLGMFTDYEKDYVEMLQKREDKNLQKAYIERNKVNTQDKKAGLRPSNVFGDVYGDL